MAVKIISETPITMAELKDDIKNIRERDKELNFRAQKTEEYLNLFVGLKPEHVKEITEKIEKLNIPRIKPEHITKVIDVLPLTAEEAKSVLSTYPITVTAENLKKIVDVVLPYAEMDRKEVKKQEAIIAKQRKEEEKAQQEKAQEEAKQEAEKEAEAAPEEGSEEKPEEEKTEEEKSEKDEEEKE